MLLEVLATLVGSSGLLDSEGCLVRCLGGKCGGRCGCWWSSVEEGGELLVAVGRLLVEARLPSGLCLFCRESE